MDYDSKSRAPVYQRVLVVGDDPTQAIILVTLMRQFGLCPLGPVANATEALQLYCSNRPELAIIDIGLSSIDLVAQLRQLGDLPLLFLAGHPDSPVYEQMQFAQPLIFLPKPYHLDDLQQAIKQALGLINI